MIFISLARVKEVLGIVTTEYDDLLNFYISAISTGFKTYCGRDFELKDRVETICIRSDQSGFLLSETPIDSITQIENYPGTYSFTSWGGIFLDIALSEAKLLKVSYKAGYSTAPDDLALACLNEVVRLFQTRDSRKDLISERIGTYGYEVRMEDGFSIETKQILEAYRRKTG